MSMTTLSTAYWPWHFTGDADVNEQMRNACAIYHQKFKQPPPLVIISHNVTLLPLAGLQMQVNYFIPETAFYFAKPEVTA